MIIGFITGGQLGQMMIQSFLPFRTSEKILVLDGDKNCPCSTLCDELVLGSSKDYQTVLEFGKKCDTIILEFEHVNIEALKELEILGKRIIAQPKYVEIIQDKGKQKEFLVENNIPTAEFFRVENKNDFNLKLRTQNSTFFNFPVIQKTCFDGYDGGGVQKIDSTDEIQNAFDAPSIIEECIDIAQEFSLIIGRDDFGTEFRYPIIEQSFHSKTHIVDTVWFSQNISEDANMQIQTIGDKLINAFEGTGMYAVELFLDTNGKIFVNEIAPRVHNSGHHTIECSVTSQFEQYMRISLGFRAGSTDIIQQGVMVNILGEEGYTGSTQYNGMNEVLKMPNIHPHLYGKQTTKPHRKMGHVTVIGENLETSMKLVEIVKEKVKVVSE